MQIEGIPMNVRLYLGIGLRCIRCSCCVYLILCRICQIEIGSISVWICYVGLGSETPRNRKSDGRSLLSEV